MPLFKRKSRHSPAGKRYLEAEKRRKEKEKKAKATKKKPRITLKEGSTTPVYYGNIKRKSVSQRLKDAKLSKDDLRSLGIK